MSKSLIDFIIGAIIGIACIGFGWLTLWCMEKDYNARPAEPLTYETVVTDEYWENLNEFCIEMYELEQLINQEIEAD